MKKIVFIFFIVNIAISAYSTTYTITNSGYTFSPSAITIQHGDEINFVLSPEHNAVEVSKSTWDANGNSPIIGFSVPFGGGLVTASELPVGTHYYVCFPHAFIGMKGTITVTNTAAVSTVKNNSGINVFIPTGTSILTVSINAPENQVTEIDLYNIAGNKVSTLYKISNSAGEFSQTFDMTGKVPTGVYFVQIKTNNQIFIRKIVLQ